MPGLDGTGPYGRGPLTGRGVGRCGVFRPGLGRKTLTSLAVSLAGMVLNDARKPDGITRRLYRAFRSYAAERLGRNRAAAAVPEEKSRAGRDGEHLLPPPG